MGSYNVACSISNISINAGDPVAYIPLEVSEYPYKIGDGNNTLIYTTCFYTPTTLPIFGTYDDYGGVENIEKNRNTEIIEEYFGVPIGEVIDRSGNAPPLEPISSGMFIHQKIFDVMVNKCSRVDDSGHISSPIFGSDENDSILSLTTELKKYIKKVEKANKLYAECGGALPASHRTNYFLGSICSVFSFKDHNTFNNIYQPRILKNELKNEVIQFVLFSRGMGATNNFYFPAMNGHQCGNPWASKLLYWESLKVVAKNILWSKYNWSEPASLKWTIKYEAKRKWEAIKKWGKTIGRGKT